MKATLSLLGMYNYDNTILDNLTLPSNFESGDLATLKNNLLMETAELELLYTDFNFLKYAIGQWSAKQQLEWSELRKTQLYEYNPIWNADYNITDVTDTARDMAGTNNNVGNSTENYTRNLAENEDSTSTQTTHQTTEAEETSELKNHDTSKSGTDATTNKVYAYNNTTSGEPRDKSERTYSEISEETSKTVTDRQEELNGTSNIVNDVDKTQTGGTITTKNSTSDTNTTENENTNTQYRRYLRGNYGVTTTQDMIKQQQELVKFNLLDYIIDEFKKRFCILVY